MTDTELKRRKAICDVAGIDDIGELSDGFHTFNGLYKQRLILFAALVKAYKDKSWKSYRHEDGEYCFGGGWFIVGIDTPEGSYTYHYENKYWNMFDCADLPRAKHWDGHTEDDAETRLMSLEPEQKKDEWISCSELKTLMDTGEFDFVKEISKENLWKLLFLAVFVSNTARFTQSERKKGKWINHQNDGYVDCPFCGALTTCSDGIEDLHFCFSCGAELEWEAGRMNDIDKMPPKCHDCPYWEMCEYPYVCGEMRGEWE